jgi:hypothetical protein
VFFNLPFGCPVVINKEVGRTSVEGGTFQVINDFGVALGDNPTGNGSIEVYIPGKHGRDFYERKNVVALPLAYTQLSYQEKEKFLPTIGIDSSINFYSPVPSIPDNPLSTPLEGSTLGNKLFGVEDLVPPPLPISPSEKQPVDTTPLQEVTSPRYPSRVRQAPEAINLLASASLSNYDQHIFDPYDPMFDIDFERLPLQHMCQVQMYRSDCHHHHQHPLNPLYLSLVVSAKYTQKPIQQYAKLDYYLTGVIGRRLFSQNSSHFVRQEHMKKSNYVTFLTMHVFFKPRWI